MAHTLGSGDRLARGAVSASYTVTEKKISQKKWNDMFKDFDPETFKNSDSQKAAATGEKEVATTGRR